MIQFQNNRNKFQIGLEYKLIKI